MSCTAKLGKWFGPSDDLPPRIHADHHWLENEVLVKYIDNEWFLEWTSVRVAEVEEQYILEVRWGIRRNAAYYLSNFASVMFTVVQSGSFIVAVSPDDFGTRSGLIFTLLLTVITFKMFTASYVPKISYQTYMDVYNIVGLLFILAVLIESFLLSPVFFPSELKSLLPAKLDTAFVLIFTALWVSFHLLIFVGTSRLWFTESWESAILREKALHHNAQIGFANLLEVEHACKAQNTTVSSVAHPEGGENAASRLHGHVLQAVGPAAKGDPAVAPPHPHQAQEAPAKESEVEATAKHIYTPRCEVAATVFTTELKGQELLDTYVRRAEEVSRHSVALLAKHPKLHCDCDICKRISDWKKWL
jgi:hypothetical protein